MCAVSANAMKIAAAVHLFCPAATAVSWVLYALPFSTD